MYVINVIPLVKIPFPSPQILSYFFKEKLSKGALVQISLRKKQTNAIVFLSENLERKKIDIKKGASFKLKPIEKVISKKPVLTKNQLKLLFWMTEYYFAPLGIVARIFLSKDESRIKNYELWKNKKRLILTPETKGLVFAPFKNLGLIIIENADSSKYKSWGRQPYYDARKIAFQLAKIFKIKITLKSKLPSVETYYWAKKGKYRLISKNSEQQTVNSLIDMRKEIKRGNYSILSEKLQEELKKAEKSMFYISRRGTATFILCRDCGYVIKCPHCDVPMILHQVGSKLLCHHCGNEEKPPTLCPSCKGYRIKYFGAGTQRVEAEVKKMLPKIKIFRLDSDTAKTPAEQQKIIDKFNKLKSLPRRQTGAILIGTQMLLEKNIKPVDLVGVVSIETILNLPDYRSSERVLKTLSQLRLISKGVFLIQTYNPKSVTIEKNWKKFYDEEIKVRKALNYPPFSQIIKLSFEHKDPKKAEDEAKILLEKLKTQITNFQFPISNFQLLGPVPAFIPKIAGKHRWNIIIKSKIKDLKKRNKLLIIVPSTWKIEVDPGSLL